MLLIDIRLLDGASFKEDVILGIYAWPVSPAPS
jgi:hypothetical protein